MLRLASLVVLAALLGPATSSASRFPTANERGRPKASREAERSVIEVEQRRVLVERGFFEYAPTELADPTIDPFTGDLFVGTRDGRVRLFDSMGRIIWQRDLGSPPLGAAALGETSVHVGTANGLFWSLDRFSGEVLWSIQLKAQVLSAPILDFDVIYVGTNQDEVHALDQETGETLWVYRRSPGDTLTIRGGTGVALDGGRIYAGFSDGTVAALDTEEGRLLWQSATVASNVLRFPDSDATPVVRGGLVYATVFNDGVYAFEAESGRIRWRHEAQGAHSLTVDGDMLIVGGGKRAWGLAADSGARKWSIRLGSFVTRPTVSRGIAFLAGPEGIRMVEAKTGRPLDQFQPGSGFSTSPVAREDKVWALSNLGHLYELRLIAGSGI